MEWNFPEKKNSENLGIPPKVVTFKKLRKKGVKKEQNGVKPQTKVHVHEFCSANPSCVSDYFI